MLVSVSSKTLIIFSLRNSEHLPDTPHEVFLYHFFYQSFVADTVFLVIINQLQFWSFIDKNM